MVKPELKRPYHHGDLREALLDAVGEMVEGDGIESVSIRGAARRVGVSHPAAFRHFTDKKDLLTAYATRAASHMADALEATAEAAGSGHAFINVGVSYLRFAMEHPGEFRMIFREELLNGTDEHYQAQMARLALMLSGSGTAIEPGTALPPEAILAWSATHGLASLYLDGTLREELPPGQELDAMTQVLRLLKPSSNTEL
ncbi:TetR/AcrR family transcriptional regulator [Yoonia sp. F2084L]|uniref:TetR/AcrR family transcriptional regulator n=1 Tax=Yoonia sp. F2084L TaxID=2926419 RepID=UPI001FF5D317|nr:TetR/AcrR family transcriptional regulator [Yoonia sp. F2084L]